MQRAAERAQVRRGARCKSRSYAGMLVVEWVKKGRRARVNRQGRSVESLDTRSLGCDAKRVRLVSLAI
jgi:hypothetical protein